MVFITGQLYNYVNIGYVIMCTIEIETKPIPGMVSMLGFTIGLKTPDPPATSGPVWSTLASLP